VVLCPTVIRTTSILCKLYCSTDRDAIWEADSLHVFPWLLPVLRSYLFLLFFHFLVKIASLIVSYRISLGNHVIDGGGWHTRWICLCGGSNAACHYHYCLVFMLIRKLFFKTDCFGTLLFNKPQVCLLMVAWLYIYNVFVICKYCMRYLFILSLLRRRTFHNAGNTVHLAIFHFDWYRWFRAKYCSLFCK